jgi:cytochrome P450
MEAVMGDYRAYVDRDPYAFYSDSLERGPVCWDESMGARLALGYDEARSVLVQESVFGAVPSDVIAALLGLDWQDEQLLASCRAWNSTIFRWSETFGADEAATNEALAAAAGLDEVLLPVIRARREHRADDLISLLWDKGPDALQPWGEAEVLAQCRVLFFAGSDTTAHLLRNLLHVLLTEPGVDDRLRADPTQVGAFVDEVLRLYGPIHFRVRVALTDVELGGQVIRRGERAHPMNAAANQEPRHYPDPHRIQIDRSPLRDHLAFNAGPRFCVGAALARAEGAEVVEQVLPRSSGMDWVDGAGRPRFRGYMPRSFRPHFAALAPRAT